MNQAPAVLATRARQAKERGSRLRKCQTDLYHLATEYLGFDLLTEEFHQPILDEMDQRTALFYAGQYTKNEGDFWSRDYFKTTTYIARCIQAYLIDPQMTIAWFHAVEEKAVESGTAIAAILQNNKKLRQIAPHGMLPAVSERKFVSAAGFRLPSAPRHEVTAKSMVMKGASGESTGGHARIIMLDDIIGLNTIQDSGMGKTRTWYGSTVKNVQATRGGRVWLIGTRWADDDIYDDFKKNKKRWDIRVRACYETNGVPDWKGEPVLYTRAEIEAKRDEMTELEFACQMMNDPMPDGTRLWHKNKSEHPISLDAALKGNGRVVVLTDPAPAHVGSYDTRQEKKRGDDSKNYWSFAVVYIRVNGARREYILLDGSRSRHFTPDEGWDEALRLCYQWRTPHLCYEGQGQAAGFYDNDIGMAGRRQGISVQPHKLKHTYLGKNHYFANLASKANRQEFLICDSCPDDFLIGDRNYTGFLTQSRKWRCVGGAVNGLKFDDDANVVSFCFDPVVEKISPKPARVRPEQARRVGFPYQNPEEQEPSRVRHMHL